MIRRIGSDDGMGILCRHSGISSLDGLSRICEADSSMPSICPEDMTGMDGASFSLSSDAVDVNHPIWKCFDGDPSTYASFGTMDSGYSFEFRFKDGKRTVRFMEIDFFDPSVTGIPPPGDSYYFEHCEQRFSAVLEGADGDGWIGLGRIAVSSGEIPSSLGERYFYGSERDFGGYAPALPSLVLDFRNSRSFYRYRLRMRSMEGYYGGSGDFMASHIRMYGDCVMPISRYPLASDASDSMGGPPGTEERVSHSTEGGRGCAAFGSDGDLSRILLRPSFGCFADSVTVSVWAMFSDSLPSSSYLLSKGPSGMSLCLERSGDSVSVISTMPSGGSSSSASASFPFASVSGSWHFLCVSHGDGFHRLYVDGRMVSETAAEPIDHDETTAMSVGCGMSEDGTGHGFYRGFLADVRVYGFAMDGRMIERMNGREAVS